MQTIKFSLSSVKKGYVESKDDYFRSKFFGSPAFPDGFIGKHNLFYENYLFLMQVDLEKSRSLVECPLLPNDGSLVVFLDISKPIYKPIIYYIPKLNNKDTFEVYENINNVVDIYSSSCINPLYINFKKDLIDEHKTPFKGCKLFGEPFNLAREDIPINKILLLQLSLSEFPDGFIENNNSGYLYFFIKEEKLKALDFKDVTMISK
jgi:uncharacterized protein YwqG